MSEAVCFQFHKTYTSVEGLDLLIQGGTSGTRAPESWESVWTLMPSLARVGTWTRVFSPVYLLQVWGKGRTFLDSWPHFLKHFPAVLV